MNPDETNASRILGDNTEYKTSTEGTTTFDIRFRAMTPGGETLGLIINIEAQKSSDLPYPLLKRALYYCSRLISSQNGVDFGGDDYGKIKKVYSIWLCMDTPGHESGITRYKITEESTVGAITTPRVNYDLQQVVMVYIGDDKRRLQNRLLSMLYDLFKADGNAVQKKAVLKERYHMILDPSEERMVYTMCNLSAGIAERHYYIGKADERKQAEKDKAAMIASLAAQHVSLSVIAIAAKMPVEEVEAIVRASEGSRK